MCSLHVLLPHCGCWQWQPGLVFLQLLWRKEEQESQRGKKSKFLLLWTVLLQSVLILKEECLLLYLRADEPLPVISLLTCNFFFIYWPQPALGDLGRSLVKQQLCYRSRAKALQYDYCDVFHLITAHCGNFDNVWVKLPEVIDMTKNYQSSNHIQILFLFGFTFVIYSVT